MKKVWLKLNFAALMAGVRIVVSKYVTPSIEVVQALKNAVNSPVIPVLTALIPGNVDDVIAAHMKKVLPHLLTALQAGQECGTKQTNDEILQCVILHLKKLKNAGNNAALDAFYLNLASLLSQQLSDGKIDWSEAVILVQYVYNEKFKNR
jgi:hypothetical protein